MHKIILLILFSIGAFFMISHEKENPMDALTNSALISCVGFDISIASDTLYDCPGNTHLFPSDTSINYLYQWTGPNSFSSSNWEVYVNQRGVYGLTVQDTLNGCIATDSIYVRQTPCEDLSSEFIPPGIEITVYLDTLAPSFTVPVDTIVYTSDLCAVSTTSAFTGEVIDEADNCDPNLDVVYQDSTISNCSGSITIYRRWTVRDDCSNEVSGIQVITVQDSIGPTISVPSDITISLDNTCQADTSMSQLGNYLNVSDNCSSGAMIPEYSTTIVPLCAGSYQYIRTWTVADECGNISSASQTVTVVDNQAPVINVPSDTLIFDGGTPTNATAIDNCSTVLTLSSSDSTVANGCNTTLYRTWTASDECGNSIDSTQVVQFINGLAVSISVSDYNGQNISCIGAADGSIGLIPVGGVPPYTYQWSNGSTVPSAINLDTGSYTIIVMDNSACSDTVTVVLTQPDSLILVLNPSNPSCVQTTNGSIDLTVSGGVGPYSYNWTPTNEITEDISNLSSGWYNVEVTDANGCSVVDSVEIIQPLALIANIDILTDYNGFPVSCNGAGDASIAVSILNANGSLTYAWSNGSNLDTLQNLTPGRYWVTATDGSGCSITDSIDVIDNPGIDAQLLITSDYNGSPVSCVNSADGTLDVTASGGLAPYTYNWSTGQSGNTINGLDTGLYFVTATDANGCAATDSIAITFSTTTNIQLSIDTDYNGDALSCFGSSDAQVSATVSGGNGPYSFLWNTGSSNDTLVNLSAGLYTVSITDANGCQNTSFISIPNPDPLEINFNTTLANCGVNDGNIYVAANNGSGNYEYSLDSVIWQGSSTFENLAPGSYSIYARDVSYGCSGGPQIITVYTAQSPTIHGTTDINPNTSTSNDGAILVNASGIGLDLEYRIAGQTPWQVSNLFDQLGTGTYDIEVRYQDQTCISAIQVTLIAGGGITGIDSTTNICSDELSNISNLEVYYVPIAEDQILNALQTITPMGCADQFSVDPIQNYIYVGVVESGTTITFDHWEDGFEPNFDFSIQPSTEIWGDGNPDNGIPPGYNIDYLEAGDDIFLNNAVISTTRQAVIDYDAGDRVSSRGAISITRLGWATGSSTLFAGAVEVHERGNWGQNYTIPVGQNTDVNDMFVYTGFSVMAGADNTQISIDADNNGIFDQVISLNEGESYLFNGGVFSGGTIEATAPVQVHLITGDDCSNYESRWFTLSPEENWDNGYYIPVSTLNNGSSTTNLDNKPTYVHLFNPLAAPLDVVYRTESGIQDTLTVPPGGTIYQEIPQGTGAHFGSTENFYAIATIDSDDGNNTANDWGFALLPERHLSPQIYLSGFAPGQNPAFTCDVGISIPTTGYAVSSSSSETTIANGDIDNAFDGDLSTAWFSEYSGGPNDHPHEVIIDLGQTHNVIGFKHINALSTVSVDNYPSPNPPVTIPNNSLYTTSTSFVINDDYSIIDLDLEIDFTHHNIGELTIILESPSGTQLRIVDEQCGSANDLVATFDDSAANTVDCLNSAVGSSFKALDDIAVFEGEFTAGIWTLYIEDHYGLAGGGSLNSWSLNITHGVSSAGSIRDFEFFVSDDGINWGRSVASGTWVDSIPIHDVRTAAIDARYVRFVSLSDFGNLGIASIGEFEVLECGSSYEENSSPIWITAGHAGGWSDTADITICVDFNGDGGSILDANGAEYDSSFVIPPLGLLKIYDPDGGQTGMRIWVCDGSDGIISGAWGQDPATASPANPAIDLGVGLINSIPYSAQKCVELENDYAGNNVYDKCDEVTYTIVIRNTGALPLSTGSIQVIDTLPAALEYIPGSSRGIVDGLQIDVPDDSINTTVFPFDEGGSTIDTIILPGDSLLVKFDALIAYVDFGTFITNQAYTTGGNNSFEPFVSFPVQEPVNPLDSIVPMDTLVSCEAFQYPDPSIDTLSYLSIHDTIIEGACLDAFTFQRIYTFTDNCYQEYIDTMVITVIDTTPPVIQLPADTTISIHDLPFVINVGDSDNCDTDVDITYTDDTTYNACSYVVERIYVAEDNCSNTSQDTIRITVIEDQTIWPVQMSASDLWPCVNNQVIVQSTLQNQDGLPYTPQWYFRSDTLQSWTAILSASQVNHMFNATLSNRGYYQVRFVKDTGSSNGNCLEHIGEIYINIQDPLEVEYVNATICSGETYLFEGNPYSTTGSYQDTLTSMMGCDSIVQLNLIALPPDRTNLADTTCYGVPYSFGNQFLDQSGTYLDTLVNQNGCDSILQLDLYVRPEFRSSLDIAICSGEVFNYNEKTFSNSGSFEEVFIGSSGCDSLVTLNLVVLDMQESMTFVPVCFGDSILIDGNYISQSGIYETNLFSQYGCDSIARYEVEVDETLITSSIEYALCEGDSLLFGNQYVSEAGTFQSLDNTPSGCDSLTIMQLTIVPRIQLTAENFEICQGSEVQLNVQGADQVNWVNSSDLNCSTCPNPIVQPLQTTTYEAFAESCLGEETRVSMTVDVLPSPEIYIDRDTSILLGEILTLHADVNDATALTNWYTSVGDVLCVNCLTTEVVPVENTHYIVEATNDVNCIDRDSIMVEVRDGCVEGELIIPNFITPNGDGDNDEFTIKWAGIKSADKLRIFNRWGEMVFSSEALDKDFWDGKINGTLVNPGVYVYYLEYYCLSNELQRMKGNVTVIR